MNHGREGAYVVDYRDLRVWRKGIELVKLVYELTSRFPAAERFGLTAQMRRAAVSVPSNVAEGQARRTTGEFIQFLSYAEGSLAELDTQLVIAAELQYCTRPMASIPSSCVRELRRMLNGLRRQLEVRRPAS